MRNTLLAAPLDLSTLRSLWKPRRDSYANARLYEDNRIRIHRAFTWLERAARCREQELDDRVLAQWSGLAALFARWDERRGQPVPEQAALAAFVRQLAATDHDGILAATIDRERTLVSSMFADRYLARHFEAVDPRELLARRRWDRVLAHLLERCALVHAQLAQGLPQHRLGLGRIPQLALHQGGEHLQQAALGAVQGQQQRVRAQLGDGHPRLHQVGPGHPLDFRGLHPAVGLQGPERQPPVAALALRRAQGHGQGRRVLLDQGLGRLQLELRLAHLQLGQGLPLQAQDLPLDRLLQLVQGMALRRLGLDDQQVHVAPPGDPHAHGQPPG